MYIQVTNNPESPVLLSRKLFKALNFPKGRNPSGFIQLARITGTDTFVIVKRTNADTFKTQCSMVSPVPNRNRRTPAMFYWTIPSLEYFLGITGITIITSVILKVEEVKNDNLTYYKICNK